MVKNFSAYASMLGYLYQIESALLLLINRPGSNVSIEYLDDVAFENNDNPQEIIQMKHHIKSKGSLGNTSTDLWKTLRVWCENIEQFESDGDEKIRILMTTDTAQENSAAQKLRPNENDRDPNIALQILESVAKSQKSQSNKEYYKKFLDMGETKRKELVESILVLDSSPDIIKTRRAIMERLQINSRPEHLDAFFERIWGKWVNMVTDVLYFKSKSTISYDELNSHIQDIRDQFTQENLPIDFLDNEPTTEEIMNYKDFVFVKQLELIVSSNTIIEFAIMDYWKAYQQRSKWLKNELLYDAELIKYEKRLSDAWIRMFERMKIDLNTGSAEHKKRRKGYELFNWADSSTTLCIRDKCTEPYVTRGSFHILANQLKIGWHVDFCERLKHLVKGASEMTR